MNEPAPTTDRRFSIGWLVGALLAGAIAGGVAGRLASTPAPKPAATVTVIRPTPNVVTAVRDLARLESAEFHVERVLDLRDKQSRFFGLVEAEDALLLVATGTVTAGVDLSKLGDDAVQVDSEKKTAHIRLPKAEILGSKLDNDHTYVHSRSTDVLAKRQESLESRARQEAEKSIVEGARQNGILARAQKNAERTVESLVRSLGYDSVTVESPRPK
ncbi:MAG: DUF4230 domain-containing protein [Myxococcales bacterium]|nr:DUF4230 domain-containing protein [Myxococcales bacterium]MCB9577842.1 DUF4230 domain-containing protein [Polyangiaceae bacterium]